MRYTEHEELKAVTSTLLGMESALASGNLNKDTVKLAYDTYKSYVQLALPYSAKKATIKQAVNKTNIEAWKKSIAAYKEKLNAPVKP